MNRRAVLLAGAIAFTAGSAGLAIGAADQIQVLTARDAADRAARGEILLVDIRSPAEWRQTGIGQSALALSMHQPDFMGELARRAGKDRSRQIALICARGGRSRFMALRLAAAGYSSVHDVPEGMLGSGAGPGWVARGLPLRRFPGQGYTKGR